MHNITPFTEKEKKRKKFQEKQVTENAIRPYTIVLLTYG